MSSANGPFLSASELARVRTEVTELLGEVPLYAGRPSSAPPASNDGAQFADWMRTIPTISKRDLRRGFPRSMVRTRCDLKAEMQAGKVEIIATSGTTEDRMQVLWENSWWDPQEREAMRLNARLRETLDCEYREAVLTTPVCGGTTCHIGNIPLAERIIDGMLFLNQVADPSLFSSAELDRMVTEWNDFRPTGVEADPAYLAALCRHVTSQKKKLHSPAYVALTYELTTHAHRRAIAPVLDSPLYTLYGATEAGVLFMECTEGRLHHNARHSHIELLPVGNPTERLGRVVVTTLGRTWMPLLRYELGDVVRIAEGSCKCGLPNEGYLLARMEGRFDDCVVRGDKVVTPAELDDLIDDGQLTGWQLHQKGEQLILHVVGSDGAKARAALQPIFGEVSILTDAAILPEGSGKYRLVKRAA